MTLGVFLGIVSLPNYTKEERKVQVSTGVRPTSLEDLGIERKPFYTTAEVARVLKVSDQHILDRIHAPADDPQHLYAIALGPRLSLIHI